MGRIEDLATKYGRHIGTPWQRNLAGDQKTIFVVYPKTDERKLRARLALFEMETTSSGHGWRLLDLADAFAQWMTTTEYRDEYFKDPDTLSLKLRHGFLKFVANRLRQILTAEDVDENTVIAIHGVAGLFGFIRVSQALQEVAGDIRGRLLVFFPGSYENNKYKLLDAGDGWNYLAVPITVLDGVNE